jgi:hypothetical protein
MCEYQSTAFRSMYSKREVLGTKSSREAPSGRTRMPPSRAELDTLNSLCQHQLSAKCMTIRTYSGESETRSMVIPLLASTVPGGK